VKTMLQGVVERGTAASIRRLAPYVAGKTGTTENENDAWFAGFTNDVTIAVWVGYDNADGKRRTLGRGQTGAKVAIPIFEPIVQAVWAQHAPKTALNGPSAETKAQIADLPIDLQSGERVTDGRRTAFVEHFRLDGSGRLAETQYRLVPQEQVYASRAPYRPSADEDPASSDGYGYGYGPYAQAPTWQEERQPRLPSWRDPSAAPWWDDDEMPRQRQRRIDPDYLWPNRRIY
jgi:penicillin-binding protein 1A